MERDELLQRVIRQIAASGLITPARLLLDIARPLDIVGSSAASFLRPLLPLGTWQQYASVFEDPASWQALRERLEHQDY